MEARADEFRQVRAVRDHWRKTPNFEEMMWWEINLAFGEGSPIYNLHWIGHEAGTFQFEFQNLPYEYNPARAKQLLAEAGYPDGFGVDMFLTGRAEVAGEVAASMWRDIGIETRLIRMPYPAFRPSLIHRSAKGVHPWTRTSPVEPIRTYTIVYSANGVLNFGFEHPTFQKLLVAATDQVGDDRRWAVQAEMAAWIFENVMTIPLYEENVIWPLGTGIDEWKPLPRVYEWLSNWEEVPHRR